MEKILIIDDDEAITESLRLALKDRYELFLASTPSEVLRYISIHDMDVILLDLKLGKYDGMEIYSEISRLKPNVVVIIITAYGTIKSSIDAIKKGVFHYLTKPIDLTELKLIIEKGIAFSNLYKQVNYLSEELKKQYELKGIVAKSASMQNILKIVEKVTNIDSNILITGESGTGKEVIAKAIHYEGKRKNYKFDAVNCAAIPGNLLESELFGYEAGAFTGAQRNKKGRFESAHKGTLLLDEIGEMEPALQSKLLRVIEDKVIIPLGSNQKKQIDVRIISTTNKNLEDAIKNGTFREDLFYRLNVINIQLPPLRERKEDIPHLMNFFVNKYNRILNKNITSIDPMFLKYLSEYKFKGNVRELENIIERAIALSNSDKLSSRDLPKYIINGQFSRYCGDELIPVFVGETLNEIEKKVIKKTYEFCKRNQKNTANILGITDRTLRNKLKEY